MSIPSATASKIVAIRLVCRNLVETTTFYETAFGCRRAETHGVDAALSLGAERLEFYRYEARHGAVGSKGATNIHRPVSNATAFQHCAIVVSDMDAAMAQLRKAKGWTPISLNGPEQLPKRSGGIRAFKFRDPESHPLELIEFANAKRLDERRHGRDEVAASHGRQNRLFLGIDHSAITVSNTDVTLGFYAALGFTVAGRQTNFGPEQARLDGVENPVVDVTALTLNGHPTPHLELLCYRQPSVISTSVRDDDLLATRLLLLENAMQRDCESIGSDELIRDPDGHRVICGKWH